MSLSQIVAVLIGYCAAAFAVSFAALLVKTSRKGWFPVLLAAVMLGCLIASTAAASRALPGRNIAVQLILALVRFEPKTTLLVFTGGAMIGTMVGVAAVAIEATWSRVLYVAGHLATTSIFSLLILVNGAAITRSRPADPSAAGSDVRKNGAIVQEIASLSIKPTSLAVAPNGTLYVAGYVGSSFHTGSIVRLERTSDGMHWREHNAALDITRPHGIAFHDGSLFVSRSGQYQVAKGGVLVSENTGAVTRLDDLDGDGVFDRFEDVVTGLPGAQPPYPQHTNNGIAFDGRGRLYVAVGSRTDKRPDSNPWGGVVLRVSLSEDEEPEVFAEGFRNPYDIVFGPEDALFGTDNDSSRGNGDELNHIRNNSHYGHPYNAPATMPERIEGAVDPIFRFPDSAVGAEGITYAPPESQNSGFDDCLYVACMNGDIYRFRLTKKADTFVATGDVVARIPGGPIDIAAAPHDGLYVCTFMDAKIYHISLGDK